MVSPYALTALDEISHLKTECLALIDQTLSVCVPDVDGNYPEAFRIVATPFLYAIWERCFRTSFGVMLKLVRQEATSPALMTFDQAALWLQREPFYTSFIDRIRQRSPDSGDDNIRKIIRGSTYKALVEFMSSTFGWHASKLGSLTDPADLVMTFSNVNVAVLVLNAEAVGLTDVPEFTTFRKSIGRLDDLVGRRNDISHGTLAYSPGNREFKELVALSRDELITTYCELVELWIGYR